MATLSSIRQSPWMKFRDLQNVSFWSYPRPKIYRKVSATARSSLRQTKSMCPMSTSSVCHCPLSFVSWAGGGDKLPRWSPFISFNGKSQNAYMWLPWVSSGASEVPHCGDTLLGDFACRTDSTQNFLMSSIKIARRRWCRKKAKRTENAAKNGTRCAECFCRLCPQILGIFVCVFSTARTANVAKKKSHEHSTRKSNTRPWFNRQWPGGPANDLSCVCEQWKWSQQTVVFNLHLRPCTPLPTNTHTHTHALFSEIEGNFNWVVCPTIWIYLQISRQLRISNWSVWLLSHGAVRSTKSGTPTLPYSLSSVHDVLQQVLWRTVLLHR